MQKLSQLSLVLGGARSGKSTFAEGFVRTAGPEVSYIATAEAHDDEMRARIEKHRVDRGEGWTTYEAPHDVPNTLAKLCSPTKAALLDCATLWLSNRLLAGADLEAEIDMLIKALLAANVPIVVVSNEVGWSIVPENKLARAFRDAQGRLNQRLAQHAELVVMVVAGLPMVLKGSFPDHHQT